MKKFFNDFKEFAVKGNVLDLAVGVIIGGAFGKIVTSLVNDIITPLLSMLLGKINLKDLSHPLVTDMNGSVTVSLKYGIFLQNIIDFLIIALSIFLVIRIMSKFKKKQENISAEKKEEKLSKEVELLTEIRDLLMQKNELE